MGPALDLAEKPQPGGKIHHGDIISQYQQYINFAQNRKVFSESKMLRYSNLNSEKSQNC